MIVYFAAVLCVIGLAIGQILFKLSAVASSKSGTLFAIQPLVLLFVAMCLYGVTSLAWIWVLQKVELGRVYPLMALAFILVPLFSHLVLGEQFQPQYFVGVTMIMVGIIVAVMA